MRFKEESLKTFLLSPTLMIKEIKEIKDEKSE